SGSAPFRFVTIRAYSPPRQYGILRFTPKRIPDRRSRDVRNGRSRLDGSAGLPEPVNELIRVAADRLVEHLGGMRVVRIAQRVARAVELEARGFHFLLHQHGIYAMQRVGIRRARTSRRHMIDDHVYAAGLQRIEN